MTFSFFYFWIGNSKSSNPILLGNYDGVRVSETELVTGKEGTHGVEWNEPQIASYKNKNYQKIDFSGYPLSKNCEFVVGSDDADTLIVRYLGSDPNQEKMFKKQTDEKFIFKINRGMITISVGKTLLEAEYSEEDKRVVLTGK